jgi:hypothetical protein
MVALHFDLQPVWTSFAERWPRLQPNALQRWPGHGFVPTPVLQRNKERLSQDLKFPLSSIKTSGRR